MGCVVMDRLRLERAEAEVLGTKLAEVTREYNIERKTCIQVHPFGTLPCADRIFALEFCHLRQRGLPSPVVAPLRRS